MKVIVIVAHIKDFKSQPDQTFGPVKLEEHGLWRSVDRAGPMLKTRFS